MTPPFADYARALDAAGAGWPRLIIDVKSMDNNIAAVSALAAGRWLRLVDKSLPSAAVLRRIADKVRTRRFMSFHAPFLVETARSFPDADILLGKPLPPAAVERVIAALEGSFDWASRIAWLADTPECLAGLAGIAARTGATLRVAVEIDVGLHRGGCASPPALAAMLDRMEQADLRFAGVMGYDAHVAKAPFPWSPTSAAAAARRRYSAFVDVLRARGRLAPDTILNGAGSPTLPLHRESPCNELSIGSAFVKPSDFDVPGLEELRPAAFIAAPILKRAAGVSVPFLEPLGPLMAGGRDMVCIYGGKWMARPVWPKGLVPDTWFGESSNQQRMLLARNNPARPGDWAFFRPTQSEAVLFGFGALALFQGGEIIEDAAIYREDVI
jgi:D-serine deaminase-like pyridoxal phosphate-dependent protein